MNTCKATFEVGDLVVYTDGKDFVGTIVAFNAVLDGDVEVEVINHGAPIDTAYCGVHELRHIKNGEVYSLKDGRLVDQTQERLRRTGADMMENASGERFCVHREEER